MSVRQRVWEIMEVARPGDRASSAFDFTILSLIILNVIAVIVGTIPSVYARWGLFLDGFEVVSVAIFTVEYVARIWSCTVDGRFSGILTGRVRFVLKPMSLVDVLAILPFYLPFLGIDLRAIRVLRMLRILRLAKAGRYVNSFGVIKDVLRENQEELVLSTIMMLLLLVVASTILYYCENHAQPEAFASIPHTMWWAIATLTTVGYGDVAPVTALGRFFASVIAVIGIGMFALPAGILGAGFVDAIGRKKKLQEEEAAARADAAPEAKTETGDACCPHCGGKLPN